jgi:hypothetical protein
MKSWAATFSRKKILFKKNSEKVKDFEIEAISTFKTGVSVLSVHHFPFFNLFKLKH